jgi:hypothetical protein
MRLSLLALTSALLASAPLTVGDKSKPMTFSKDQDGKLPTGWKVASTGKDAASAWSVVADDTAPGKTGHALMQTGVSPGPAFNLCVQDDSSFLDGEIEVAFKAVKGEKDQGGGIVWRYQDANNYYLARMNPLEDNVRVYKVVDGKRIQLATKENLVCPTGTWHKLKIKQTGKQIEVYVDGKKYLEASDDTFQKAGKVGLWTKADAETRFDVFEVRAAGKGS